MMKYFALIIRAALVIMLFVVIISCSGSGQSSSPEGNPNISPQDVEAADGNPMQPGFIRVSVSPQQPVEFADKQVVFVKPSQLVPQLTDSSHAGKSTSSLIRSGSEYASELQSNLVNVVGKSVEFAPQFAGGSLAGLAYCMFTFELDGYDGNPTLAFDWDTRPVTDSLWVGIGNRTTNTWDWFSGPQDDVLTLASFDEYESPADPLLVTVALVGNIPCKLGAISVGDYEMRPLGALDAEAVPDTPPLAGAGQLPSSFDLSPGCSPVRQQYPWQSCTAFAVGDGAYNYELNSIYGDYGWDFSDTFNLISPKFIFVESGKSQNMNSSDVGRNTQEVIAGLQDDYGSATELNAPYNFSYDDNWGPAALADANLLQIDSWDGVPCNTMAGVNSVKAILAFQLRPVIMRTQLDNGIFAFRPGSDLAWNFIGPSVGGHAMCIVGFDDTKDAFLVRNSWGIDWGNDGYLWIGYNTFINPAAYVRCYVLADDYDDAVAQRFCNSSATLAPPVNVEATDGLFNNKIVVTWTKSPSATGYKIYRDQLANDVATLGDVATWDDLSLDDTFAHAYWVQATIGAQTSQLSSPDWGYLESGGVGYDETEDNDGYTTANALPPMPFDGFTGSIGDGGYDGDRYDYFTFEAEEGQILIADLAYNLATANIYLRLYDEGQSRIARDDTGNNGTRRIELGLHAGTHYLVVYSATGSSDYTLAGSLTNGNYDEVEDNDGTTTANVLSLPVSGFKGSVGDMGGTDPPEGGYDGDDYDYFVFTADEGDLLDASFTYDNTAGANFTYRLYDSDSLTIARDEDGNPGSRSIRRGLKAGSYFLRVRANAGWEDYYMTVNLTPGNYDETEDNDGSTTANVLSLPVSGFKGSVGTGSSYDPHGGYDGDDYDYFVFTAEEGDLLDASYTYDNTAGANFTFRLYDSDLITIARDEDGNPGSRSIKRGLKAGSYYLRVRANEGWEDYYMAVDLTPGNYTETEDNDGPSQADVLSLPIVDFLGSIGPDYTYDPHGGYDGDDNDYSTFTLSSGQIISITVTYEPTDVNLYLRLLNSGGGTITSDTSGNPGTRSITEALSAGSYFIRVYESQSEGYGDYTMDVSGS